MQRYEDNFTITSIIMALPNYVYPIFEFCVSKCMIGFGGQKKRQ